MAAAVGATHRGIGPPQSSGAQHQVLGTSLTVQDSPFSLPSPLPFPPTSSLQSRAGREGYWVGTAGAKMVVESMFKTSTRERGVEGDKGGQNKNRADTGEKGGEMSN